VSTEQQRLDHPVMETDSSANLNVVIDKKTIVVAVNLHNTVTLLNEAIMKEFEKKYQPKKSKTVEDFKFFTVESNLSAKESGLVKEIYQQVANFCK
jgi:hypothetical protein